MPAAAPRLVRNAAFQLRKESTYGADAAPVNTDAVLFSQCDYEIDIAKVTRDNPRPFFGVMAELAGRELARIKFTHELAARGTAGVLPRWANCLYGLGFASTTLTSPDRVEFTPVSDGFDSFTGYAQQAGIQYASTGGRGTGTIDVTVGKVPTISVDITALHQGESAVDPAASFANWSQPLVLKPTNVVDFTYGGTYSAGAYTGGTKLTSRGFTLDIGNQVEYVEVASGDYVAIVDRKMKGTITFDLTVANELTQINKVRTSAPMRAAFTIGSGAGNTILLYMPWVQLTNPKSTTVNGIRMLTFDMTLIPDAGNDELRIVLP